MVIACRDCAKPVSGDVAICPHCGSRVTSRPAVAPLPISVPPPPQFEPLTPDHHHRHGNTIEAAEDMLLIGAAVGVVAMGKAIVETVAWAFRPHDDEPPIPRAVAHVRPPTLPVVPPPVAPDPVAPATDKPRFLK